MFVGPLEVLHGYPREVACHVTTRAHASSLLFEAVRAEYELFDYFYRN